MKEYNPYQAPVSQEVVELLKELNFHFRSSTPSQAAVRRWLRKNHHIGIRVHKVRTDHGGRMITAFKPDICYPDGEVCIGSTYYYDYKSAVNGKLGDCLSVILYEQTAKSRRKRRKEKTSQPSP